MPSHSVRGLLHLVFHELAWSSLPFLFLFLFFFFGTVVPPNLSFLVPFRPCPRISSIFLFNFCFPVDSRDVREQALATDNMVTK